MMTWSIRPQLRRSVRCSAPLLAALVLALAPSAAHGQEGLSVLQAQPDVSTVVTLGVRVPVEGDTDRTGNIAVRYRKADSCSGWRPAANLFRVNPDHVNHEWGAYAASEFAGSIFNLQPDTEYEIELTASDEFGGILTPDRAVQHLRARTRPIPRTDPLTPHEVAIGPQDSLQSYLDSATAGTVITLAPGTYQGIFSIDKKGTADNPIVIRGTPGAVLRGADPNKTVLWIKGDHIHVEDLAVENGLRGIFIGASIGQGGTVYRTIGNTVRRVAISGVGALGIASAADQQDLYICDNTLQGPLAWPDIYAGDENGDPNANIGGIRVSGTGNVVCHNEIRGFGDAVSTMPAETPANKSSNIRATDIYGNLIRSGYDNGVELDYSFGNVRVFRNLFLNTLATISFQPIYGGPAYAFRNVSVNTAREQFKFSQSPSGMLLYHNTFVSAPLINSKGVAIATAVNLMQGEFTSYDFTIENNLFIGLSGMNVKTVNWDNGIDSAVINFNGYSPDGVFRYGATATPQPSFSALKAYTQWEHNGVLLTENPFASGLSAPSWYTTEIMPEEVDATLKSGSNQAVDAGIEVFNINDGLTGTGPDLGAIERDCALPPPIYGVRPPGVDETNEPIGCEGRPAPGCVGEARVWGCPAQPAAEGVCRAFGGGKLTLKRRPTPDDAHNTLHLKCQRGQSPPADFADPLTADYMLCVYSAPASGPATLLFSALAPAGGDNCGFLCGGSAPCWKSSASNPFRWYYKDRGKSPDGLLKVQLAAHETKAKIQFRGAGDCLRLPPTLAFTTDVVVQVINSSPSSNCWEARFNPMTPPNERVFSAKFDVRVP